MIQRVQTIWLLIASALGFVEIKAPLYEGVLAGQTVKELTANQSLPLFALTAAVAVLALVTIFLYKNRSAQMTLIITGIFVSAALIGLEVWQENKFQQINGIQKGSFEWGALLPVAIIISLLLAARNISKDNKLIKSLDRLR